MLLNFPECYDFVYNRVHACPEYENTLNASDENLAILSLDEGWKASIAKARLAGKNADIPDVWVEYLQNVPCDTIEEAEAVAKNNGMLIAVAWIADKIGYKGIAKRARKLILTY